MANEWKCVGCGDESPDGERRCSCATGVVFRLNAAGNVEHGLKKPSAASLNALSNLRKAIIDNTKGDLFWIGEILLSELEKETGFGAKRTTPTK